jgi:hypothetical protein
MTQALENACNHIVTVLLTVPGIDAAPINPPETVNQNTVCLVFPENGEKDASPLGVRKGLHNIAIYLMRRRIDLANDIAAIKPFIDTISDALLSEVSDGGGLFGGSITAFEKVTYKFEFLEYAGVEFVVYHFVMQNVKIIL